MQKEPGWKELEKEDQDLKDLLSLLEGGDVHELSELQRTYKGTKELQPLLTEMVSNGKLFAKTVEKDKVQFHLYWTASLAKEATPTRATPSRPIMRSSSLKRTGLKFTSPFLTKRHKVTDQGGGAVAQKLAFTSEATQQQNEGDSTRRRELLRSIAEKEERLRRLKMVEIYKSKHDIKELERLTKKWRNVSQEAACQLLSLSTHPDKSLRGLLDCLNIDYKTIHYSIEEDNFY